MGAQCLITRATARVAWICLRTHRRPTGLRCFSHRIHFSWLFSDGTEVVDLEKERAFVSMHIAIPVFKIDRAALSLLSTPFSGGTKLLPTAYSRIAHPSSKSPCPSPLLHPRQVQAVRPRKLHPAPPWYLHLAAPSQQLRRTLLCSSRQPRARMHHRRRAPALLRACCRCCCSRNVLFPCSMQTLPSAALPPQDPWPNLNTLPTLRLLAATLLSSMVTLLGPLWTPNDCFSAGAS